MVSCVLVGVGTIFFACLEPIFERHGIFPFICVWRYFSELPGIIPMPVTSVIIFVSVQHFPRAQKRSLELSQARTLIHLVLEYSSTARVGDRAPFPIVLISPSYRRFLFVKSGHGTLHSQCIGIALCAFARASFSTFHSLFSRLFAS